MRKVAVFFGGKSYEREISILTGLFAVNLLWGGKYTILPVYVHTDGEMYTSSKMTDVKIFQDVDVKKFQRIFFESGYVYAFTERKNKIKKLEKIDVALNCCHGGLGEGGGLSAIMQWNDIPLASPELTASAVFLDKCLTKLIMRALSVPVVDFIRVNESDYQKRGAFLLKNIESRLHYPVIVKPANLGSSIGVAVAKNETEAKRAIEEAFLLDHRVIIEKYLQDKKDVNCAAYALNGEIYVCEPELAFENGVYSFEEKYVKKDGQNKSDFSKNTHTRVLIKGEMRDKIRAHVRTVYKRLNLQGVVRMDFLVSGGKSYLCEVNTVPGSLAYYFFCERISDAKTFFEDLISEALREKLTRKKPVFDTGILKKGDFTRK